MQCPACRHVFEAPKAKPALTRRQAEVLNYVLFYMASKGYAPTQQEIADHFGWTSSATVHMHLANLERKGALLRDRNLARAITAVDA